MLARLNGGQAAEFLIFAMIAIGRERVGAEGK